MYFDDNGSVEHMLIRANSQVVNVVLPILWFNI